MLWYTMLSVATAWRSMIHELTECPAHRHRDAIRLEKGPQSLSELYPVLKNGYIGLDMPIYI